MTAQYGREHHSGHGWHLRLIALLVVASMAPHGGAAATGSRIVDQAGTAISWLVGSPPPVANSVPIPVATKICGRTSIPVLAAGNTPEGTAPVRGGQQIVLRAGALPKHATFRLVVDVPRVRRSGNVAVPITFSPPTLPAASDDSGRLVSANGKQDIRVRLPDDTSGGVGTISLLRQVGTSAMPTQEITRSWRFLVAPRPPAMLVQARDVRGRQTAHAMVTYSGTGADGTLVSCRGMTDSRGNLLLSGIVDGPATIAVRKGNTQLGVYHPVASAGEITVVGRAPVGPVPPYRTPANIEAHSFPFCTAGTGYIDRLLDSASGVATAKSGDGPFGVFLEGTSTLDTFTAQVTRKAPDGGLVPIRHDTPVTLYAGIGNDFVPVARGAYGADLSGGNGAPGYTPVTIQYDMQHFTAGTNYIELEVGTGDHSCQTVYQIKIVRSPGNTLLGTVDTYFDPATDSYQITGVLPTKPRLHFSQNIDLSIPAQDLPEVHLPDAVFQDWQNEGDVGLDVNETIRTDGSWTGTVGGHARLTLFNHVLYNEELPTLTGGGPNLASGSMSHTFQLARKNVDVSLFNYLIFIPELAIVIVVNVRLGAVGNLEANIGVPGMLNAAEFTLNPTLTAKIIGSATIPTPIGDFSGALDGSLALAAPITLRAPGAPQGHVGIQASINATFSSPFSDHPSTTTIVKSPCLGDCGSSFVPIISRGPIVGTITPLVDAPGIVGTGLRYPHDEGQSHVSIDSGAPANAGGSPLASILRSAEAAGEPVEIIPLVSVAEQPRTTHPQPATSLSPDGRPATLWVANGNDGSMKLQAQIGSGQPQTVTTNRVTLASPRIAWIGPHRVLAVWVASTANPGQLDQYGDAPQGTRTALLQALIAHQQIFTATWNGYRWSRPEQITHGDVLNGEPSLAVDPKSGHAALLWVRGSTSAGTGAFEDLGLAGAEYIRGLWSPMQAPATMAVRGVSAPNIAFDTAGHPAVAWLAGPPGMGRPMFARWTARGWSTPVPIQGLPSAAQDLSLSLDDRGRPLVAEEATQALWAARQDPSGLWKIWDLGAGSRPRLAAGAASSMLLLALRPGAASAPHSIFQSSLTVLRGDRWSGFAPLVSTIQTGEDHALAADPRSGIARVVVALDGRTGRSPDSRAATPQAHVLDSSSGVTAVEVSPGTAATLVPEAIALSNPHPRPGMSLSVRVRVRNLGATPVAAGTPLDLRIALPDRVRSYTLHTDRRLAFNATAMLEMPLMGPTAPLTITVVAASRRALTVVLGLPLTPRNVVVMHESADDRVQWNPAPDHGIVGYRVYQIRGHGTPMLVGFAHGTSWTDSEPINSRSVYLVTAVDAQGRESPPAMPDLSDASNVS